VVGIRVAKQNKKEEGKTRLCEFNREFLMHSGRGKGRQSNGVDSRQVRKREFGDPVEEKRNKELKLWVEAL